MDLFTSSSRPYLGGGLEAAVHLRVVDGVPRVIVRNGHCFKSVMADEKITMSELLEAMRQEGCTNILNVRVAMLENDGRISIVTR